MFARNDFKLKLHAPNTGDPFFLSSLVELSYLSERKRRLGSLERANFWVDFRATTVTQPFVTNTFYRTNVLLPNYMLTTKNSSSRFKIWVNNLTASPNGAIVHSPAGILTKATLYPHTFNPNLRIFLTKTSYKLQTFTSFIFGSRLKLLERRSNRKFFFFELVELLSAAATTAEVPYTPYRTNSTNTPSRKVAWVDFSRGGALARFGIAFRWRWTYPYAYHDTAAQYPFTSMLRSFSKPTLASLFFYSEFKYVYSFFADFSRLRFNYKRPTSKRFYPRGTLFDLPSEFTLDRTYYLCNSLIEARVLLVVLYLQQFCLLEFLKFGLTLFRKRYLRSLKGRRRLSRKFRRFNLGSRGHTLNRTLPSSLDDSDPAFDNPPSKNFALSYFLDMYWDVTKAIKLLVLRSQPVASATLQKFIPRRRILKSVTKVLRFVKNKHLLYLKPPFSYNLVNFPTSYTPQLWVKLSTRSYRLFQYNLMYRPSLLLVSLLTNVFFPVLQAKLSFYSCKFRTSRFVRNFLLSKFFATIRSLFFTFYVNKLFAKIFNFFSNKNLHFSEHYSLHIFYPSIPTFLPYFRNYLIFLIKACSYFVRPSLIFLLDYLFTFLLVLIVISFFVFLLFFKTLIFPTALFLLLVLLLLVFFLVLWKDYDSLNSRNRIPISVFLTKMFLEETRFLCNIFLSFTKIHSLSLLSTLTISTFLAFLSLIRFLLSPLLYFTGMLFSFPKFPLTSLRFSFPKLAPSAHFRSPNLSLFLLFSFISSFPILQVETLFFSIYTYLNILLKGSGTLKTYFWFSLHYIFLLSSQLGWWISSSLLRKRYYTFFNSTSTHFTFSFFQKLSFLTKNVAFNSAYASARTFNIMTCFAAYYALIRDISLVVDLIAYRLPPLTPNVGGLANFQFESDSSPNSTTLKAPVSFKFSLSSLGYSLWAIFNPELVFQLRPTVLALLSARQSLNSSPPYNYSFFLGKLKLLALSVLIFGVLAVLFYFTLRLIVLPFVAVCKSLKV